MNDVFKDQKMHCSRGRNHPDGSAKCRYIEGGTLYTCSAFICISGRHPQKDEQFDEEWRCVDQWIPLMLLEGSRTNRGQTAAIEYLTKVVTVGSEEAQKQIPGDENARLPRQ